MSTEALLGAIPLLGSFVLLFSWSGSVAYRLVPRLFDAPTMEIDHRKLGLTHSYEDLSSSTPGFASAVDVNASKYWLTFIKLLFALTISLSALVMEVVLLEVLHWLNHEGKILVLHLAVPLLIVLLTYVIPVVLLAAGVRRMSVLHGKVKFATVALGVVAWLLVLRELRYALASKEEVEDDTYLANSLRQLTILGVMALASLSGMGSISQPFYSFVKKTKPIRESDIASLTATLKTTDQLLTKRQEELGKMIRSNKSITAIAESTSLREKIFGGVTGNSQFNDLKNEVNALIQMERAIYVDLGKLQTAHELQVQQSSLPGRAVSWSRKVLAVYCCYKILSILFLRLPVILYHEYVSPERIVQGPMPAGQVSQDALAVTLAKLIRSLNPQLDEDYLVVELSFLLSSALFYCSFSSVLLTFNSLKKLLPVKIRPGKASTSSKDSVVRSLLTAELSGIYTLSTTILLLANLPEALSNKLIDALGYPDMDSKVIEVIFDKTFGVSCITTCIGIFVSESFEKFYLDEDDVYDEEAMLENKTMKGI